MEALSLRASISPILAALVVVFVAVYRQPVEIGQGREMIARVVALGAMMLVGVFLLARVHVCAAALFVLAWYSTYYPFLTKFSASAFDAFLVGLSWYAVLVIIFEHKPNLINYALCAAATIHAFITFNGGSLMTNQNEISAFFAMCVPSFFLLSKKLAWVVILPIVAMLMVKSFNGVIATGTVLVIYGIYCDPRLWLAYLYFVACGIGLVWFYRDAPAWRERLDWWGPALSLWKEAPFGVGLGNWKSIAGMMVEKGLIKDGCYRLHSTWLQGLLEMGVLFPCVVGAYAADCIRRIRKDVHIAHILGVAAFIIVASTNSLFQINAVCGLVAIALLARLELALRSERSA